MTRLIVSLALLSVFSVRADAPAKWQFAGDNQGIRFYLKIANECRDKGAKVEVRLENTLDHAVVVSFRIVDPDWKQNFEREMATGMKDTAIKFTPEEGKSCHPYVDEVYVEEKGTQVSHAGETVQDVSSSPSAAQPPASVPDDQ